MIQSLRSTNGKKSLWIIVNGGSLWVGRARQNISSPVIIYAHNDKVWPYTGNKTCHQS